MCSGREMPQPRCTSCVRVGSKLSRSIGRRHVTLQELRAGDVFGDVPAFLDEPEPFDARAVEDAVILALDMSALQALLQTRPLVA
jgi:CRP-like cAMP-binding protein